MATEKKTGQNRVAKILRLENGEEFTGKYLGITTRDYMDRKFNEGEIIALTSYIFSNKDGSRFMYRGDSGFKTAFESSLVQIGETIRVVKGDKEDIGDGKSVNTYEIFEAQFYLVFSLVVTSK